MTADHRAATNMPITEKQKRWLKKQIHHLKPVVTIGQHGLTEPVLAEVENALRHHELMKVRISAGDRELRDATVRLLVRRTGADLITRVGNVAAIYRHNADKRELLALPDL